jgi:hypothetical protein
MVSGVGEKTRAEAGGMLGKTKNIVVVLVALPIIVFIAGLAASWVDDQRQFGGKTNSSSPLSKYVITAEEAAHEAAAAPQCRADACTFTVSQTGPAATSTNETVSALATLVLPPPVDYRAPAGGFFTNLRKPALAEPTSTSWWLSKA